MGWGNAADKAKKQTEDQAEKDGIKKFSGRLSGLVAQMDNPKDREATDKLIGELNAATSENQRKQAWGDFKNAATAAAVKLVGTAAKGAIKAMLVLAVMLFVWAPAKAGILDIESPMDYIKNQMKLTKAGPAVNFKGKLGAAAYLPIYSIHNAKEGEDRRHFADFGIGYSHFALSQERIDAGMREDHIVAVAGLNLVTLSHMAWKGALGKYVEVTPMPDLWIGPIIEAPPLDNIKEKWVIGERLSIIMAYRFLGSKEAK